MTALATVAAQVKYVSGPVDHGQTIGEAAAAGAEMYLAADGKWYKAQCDGTAIEAGSGGVGMLLSTADRADVKASIARQEAVVQVAASGLTVGVPYYLGATAGALNPFSDLSSTNKVTFAGMTISATQIKLGYCYDAGAVVP